MVTIQVPARLSIFTLLAAAPEAERVTLPCYCYLVEHPKGLFLVDAGIGRVFSPEGAYDAVAAKALLGAPLSSYLRPCVASGQSIGEQLSARGLSPKDLDLVIITHLDADHVGGLHELRGAKRFLLPEVMVFINENKLYR